MKQTAVEWLVEQITNGTMSAREAIQQAKAMEKEQIMNAYIDGSFTGCGCYDYMEKEDAEQYYKETYIYECKYCLSDKRIHKCNCEYESKTNI